MKRLSFVSLVLVAALVTLAAVGSSWAGAPDRAGASDGARLAGGHTVVLDAPTGSIAARWRVRGLTRSGGAILPTLLAALWLAWALLAAGATPRRVGLLRWGGPSSRGPPALNV